MKKLIPILSVIAFLMFSAQAGKVSYPFTVTANGTNEATVDITGIAATETNWVDLAGILMTVPVSGNAVVRLYTHVGAVEVDLATTTFVNGSTNATALKLFMPRRAVWGSSNPAVDAIPLLGTNCTVSVLQSGASTNDWAFQVLIEE